MTCNHKIIPSFGGIWYCAKCKQQVTQKQMNENLNKLAPLNEMP